MIFQVRSHSVVLYVANDLKLHQTFDGMNEYIQENEDMHASSVVKDSYRFVLAIYLCVIINTLRVTFLIDLSKDISTAQRFDMNRTFGVIVF